MIILLVVNSINELDKYLCTLIDADISNTIIVQFADNIINIEDKVRDKLDTG